MKNKICAFLIACSTILSFSFSHAIYALPHPKETNGNSSGTSAGSAQTNQSNDESESTDESSSSDNNQESSEPTKKLYAKDLIKIESSGIIPKLLKISPALDNGDLFFEDSLFLRDRPATISSKNPSIRQKIHFNWLTVFQANPVIFENLDISGKIQVTAGASVGSERCPGIPLASTPLKHLSFKRSP